MPFKACSQKQDFILSGLRQDLQEHSLSRQTQSMSELTQIMEFPTANLLRVEARKHLAMTPCIGTRSTQSLCGFHAATFTRSPHEAFDERKERCPQRLKVEQGKKKLV